MNPAALQDAGGGRDCLLMSGDGPEPRRRSLLVHSCCGPCSTSVVELLALSYIVTLFFYNPNITDEDEYRRRLDAQRAFVEIYNSSPGSPSRIGLIEGPYEPSSFYEECRGYEDEPEGGARCEKCITMRLAKTAGFACMRGFDGFTTTLSVSPHKSHAMISAAGGGLMTRYGVDFLSDDFGRCGGYARSVELSGSYGLYRQNYCGCEFSRR
jgi:predicted adenine nucleotide alpha hydrolase (AANH) superfamily ATPase